METAGKLIVDAAEGYGIERRQHVGQRLVSAIEQIVGQQQDKARRVGKFGSAAAIGEPARQRIKLRQQLIARLG
ncbi:hypothetical protein ES703_90413 [subsurface metagenome]